MQILIKRASPEEVAEFFRKNRWLIERLLANSSAASDDDDCGTVDESPAPDHSDDHVAETAEELEEQIMDTLEEIEEVIDELEEEDYQSEEAQEILEEIEETLEEIVDILDGDDEEDEDEGDEDDLTQIKGLGGKTLEKLNAAGITTFQQVIDLTDEEIEELDGKIRNFAINYERKNFRQQAKDLQ